MKPIFKKKKRKIVKKEKKNDLSLNEQLFCQLYFGAGEYFGNATWAYIKAYGTEVPFIPRSDLSAKQKRQYNVARSMAVHVLARVNIIKEGDKIVKSLFNEVDMDKELAWTATQRKDLASKVQAVREFNQLKARVLKKLDITSKGKEIQPIIQIIEYGKTLEK